MIYNDISTYFYLGYIFINILIPMVLIGGFENNLRFILVIYNNQELIKTIRQILEVFPEAIVIQSIDKISDKLVMQFANKSAKSDIIEYEEPCRKPIQDSRIKFTLKINKNDDELSSSNQQSDWTLSELLQIHSQIVQMNESETTSLAEFIHKDWNLDEEFFKNKIL